MRLNRKIIFQGSTFSPRTNLPQKFQQTNREETFVNSFLKAYIKTIRSSSIFIKETAMPGLGIADLLHCAGVEKNKRVITRIRGIIAFEMKIGKWKQALTQSHKYSYFADKVVVVLPANRTHAALQNIQWFKDLKISLWSFDSNTSKITKIFDLRRNTASSIRERRRVVEKIKQITTPPALSN